MNLVIRTDGGSRGNPGPAGIGVVLEDAATNEVVETHARYLGVATNNQAEYKAVILGLERAVALGRQKRRLSQIVSCSSSRRAVSIA